MAETIMGKIGALANAIRQKTGASGGLTLSRMAASVSGITAGSDSHDAYMASLYAQTWIYPSHQTLTRIGSHAFQFRKEITNVSFPNVTSVGYEAFYNTGISYAYLPKCETVESYAFSSCMSLTSFTLARNAVIGPSAFQGCTNLKDVDFTSFAAIGGGAFARCGISSAILTNAVPSSSGFLGGNPISYISVTWATIPSYMFNGCSRLSTLCAPNVTRVEDGAFSGCSTLTSFSRLSNLTYIGGGAFESCTGFTGTISIGRCSETEYLSWTFYGCNNITSFYASNFSGAIAHSAFGNCSKLANVYAPSVSAIYEYAFDSCSALTTLTLTNVKLLSGSNFFRGCASLKTLTLNAVTTISRNGSYSAPVFPPNVEVITMNALTNITGTWTSTYSGGRYLFSGTFSTLRSVTFNAITSLPSEMNGNVNSANTTLTYFSAPKVQYIGGSAFRLYAGLTTLSFPSCIAIGGAAFYGCSGLTTIYIPNVEYQLTSGGAFYGCSRLTSAYMPKFSGHSSGTSANMLPSSMFYGCSSISYISLGDIRRFADIRAFYGCSNLKSVYINMQSVSTSIGSSYFFSGTPSTTIFYVPRAVYASLSSKPGFKSLYASSRLLSY